MAQYKIHPLEVARITAPVGVLSMGGDMQTFFVAPVLIFYIEGEGKKKMRKERKKPSIPGATRFQRSGERLYP